jgi:hypothetical protein
MFTLRRRARAFRSPFPAEGKNHNSLNDDLGKPDDKLTEALLDFLNTVLKK